MASETPKKLYPVSSKLEISFACRLCLSVGDSAHRKRLFSPGAETLLRQAEELNGKPLLLDESLPDLLCRPCERRLRNITAFKATIQASQEKLVERRLGSRVKRCVEISPSAPRPPSKSRSFPSPASDPTRLKLAFDSASPGQVSILRFPKIKLASAKFYFIPRENVPPVAHSNFSTAQPKIFCITL